MSRRQLGTLSLALLAVLAFPSAGHASIWDIIWGMSGPQMMGPVLHCEYDLQHKGGGNKDKTDPNKDERDVVECRGIDYLFFNKLKPRPERVVWLSLDAGYYFSTSKDSDGNEFDWFENHMLAFEPLVEVLSYKSVDNDFMMHHGLFGITYDVLFGKNFGTFDNAGFKFRPVGVTIGKRFNASFTLRYYPNRFTSEDFGIINPTQVKTGGEWVKGFTVGWLWGPR
jgi:hypothetical protein